MDETADTVNTVMEDTVNTVLEEEESLIGTLDGILLVVLAGVAVYYLFLKNRTKEEPFNARDTFSIS